MKDYIERINNIKDINPFVTQSEIAYKIISEDIIKSKVMPKEKINQELYAINLQMSRTPVREAVLKLEDEGLVVRGEKGYQAYDMNVKDYMDYYEFRIRLETYATFLASRIMSDEEIEKLKKILELYLEASNTDNRELIIYYDTLFHDAIIRGSANQYIIKTFDSFRVRQQYYLYRFLKNRVANSTARQKHIDIYTAIKKRDEKSAEDAMFSHLSFYRHRLYEMID